MKKFLVVAILCAAVVLYWQTRSERSPILATQASNPTTAKIATENQDHPSADGIHSSPVQLELNYADCRETLQSAKALKDKWARRQDWDKLLEQGYSVDDITLAMDHYLNKNFAASWRAKHLKQNSTLNQKNRSKTQQIKHLIPDLPSFVRIEQVVPQPQLAHIAELDQEEALTLLESTDISIDDLNWLLKQATLSQPLLLHALNQIEDINALLGYGYTQNETLHLIDTAAYHGRDQVVSALLNKGSQLSNDPYLGTTMEYALAGLDYLFRINTQANEVFERQVKIIKVLESQGSPANFFETSEQSVKGFFPRQFYIFDAKQINFLQQNQGLFLSEISRRQGLTLDKQSPLMQTLKQNLDNQLTTLGSEQERNACQTLVTRVDNTWQPRTLNFFSKKLKEENQAVTRETLNKIDPVLADCFIAALPTSLPISQTQDRELENEVYALAAKNEISKAITLIEAAQLNEAESRSFFYQLLGYDPTYFVALQNSHLHQERLSYSQLHDYARSKTTDVIAQGIDIDELDYFGKSLLDIAIARKDLNLLNYLVSQHISYPNRVMGRDPLYLLLDSSAHSFNPDQLMTYLPLLMSLEPPIQPAHLRLMALIQLKHTKLYAEITKLYPQLIVPENAPLPPAICSNVMI